MEGPLRKLLSSTDKYPFMYEGTVVNKLYGKSKAIWAWIHDFLKLGITPPNACRLFCVRADGCQNALWSAGRSLRSPRYWLGVCLQRSGVGGID